jgi:hypothetical protein
MIEKFSKENMCAPLKKSRRVTVSYNHRQVSVRIRLKNSFMSQRPSLHVLIFFIVFRLFKRT